ncbi:MULTISPECIES: TRAP transporter large permease [Aminobacterium]|jgi:tripartite ATP-independent transporter DctM subunit|uniref:TRAP transporter large permease n=1 Tax=Aminobacterium TaxID=81466 RepID=UPI00257A2A5D|nr:MULTISPECIES: TRAP transporter large permease [unclassified Aminobacterium]
MDWIIVCSLVIFAFMIFSGVPIPFGFLVSIIFLEIAKGMDPSFLLPIGFTSLNSVTLLSMPFFIALGYIVTEGSIARRLLDFANAFAGRIPGGLGIVACVTSAVFGAISGAAASSVIAIGTIMIPEMERHGYPRGYSAALISASSVLSTLIPPSITMIMYAFVTSQSVAACFLSTVIPGLILTALLSFVNVYLVKKMPSVRTLPNVSFREKIALIGEKTKTALGALLLPVLILGGIYGGVMTPTEAAAVAVIYSILLSLFIYRELSFGKILLSLRSSVTATGTMMLMTFFAAILSRIYTMEQVPHAVSTILLSLSDNKYVLLLLINVFLLFVGMIVDALSGILLVTPLLYPVILKLGIHPIHFAAIIGVNLGVGMLTPPMAGILYMGAKTGKVAVNKMMKPIMIFIGCCYVPVILATTYWEPLSLYLPRLAGLIR